MAKNLSPEHLRYKKIADGLRTGDIEEMPENMGEHDEAKAAYLSTLPKSPPTAPGWWNLPVAIACWEGDAKDLRA